MKTYESLKSIKNDRIILKRQEGCFDNAENIIFENFKRFLSPEFQAWLESWVNRAKAHQPWSPLLFFAFDADVDIQNIEILCLVLDNFLSDKSLDVRFEMLFDRSTQVKSYTMKYDLENASDFLSINMIHSEYDRYESYSAGEGINNASCVLFSELVAFVKESLVARTTSALEKLRETALSLSALDIGNEVILNALNEIAEEIKADKPRKLTE